MTIWAITQSRRVSMRGVGLGIDPSPPAQDNNVGGWIRMTNWVIFGCDRRGALKYRGHHLSRQHIIDMIKFLSKEFCVVGRPLGE